MFANQFLKRAPECVAIIQINRIAGPWEVIARVSAREIDYVMPLTCKPFCNSATDATRGASYDCRIAHVQHINTFWYREAVEGPRSRNPASRNHQLMSASGT